MADLNATFDPDAIDVTDTPVGSTLWRPVRVTDAATGALGTPSDLTAQPEEPVTVTDTPVGYALWRPVFVTDAAEGALSDNDALVQTVVETITVTDASGLAGLVASARETVTVSETTGTELSTVVVVTDTATGFLTTMGLTAQPVEPVTVTDPPLPSLVSGALSQTVTEPVSVTEARYRELGSWHGSTSDASTVADTVTDAELIELGAPLTRTRTEAVTVTDAAQGWLVVGTATHDQWRIPHERRVWRVQAENRTWHIDYERRVWRIRRKAR